MCVNENQKQTGAAILHPVMQHICYGISQRMVTMCCEDQTDYYQWRHECHNTY